MVKSKQKNDFWSVSVGHIPLQKPVIVKEITTIEETIRKMQVRNVACALVVDASGKLSGIVTGRDVMEKFIATDLPKTEPVKNLMTPNPHHLSPDLLVSDLIIFLGKTSVRHIPICHDPKNILGLLSVRDLIVFIAEHLPEEVLNLPPYHERISKEAYGA